MEAQNGGATIEDVFGTRLLRNGRERKNGAKKENMSECRRQERFLDLRNDERESTRLRTDPTLQNVSNQTKRAKSRGHLTIQLSFAQKVLRYTCVATAMWPEKKVDQWAPRNGTKVQEQIGHIQKTLPFVVEEQNGLSRGSDRRLREP